MENPATGVASAESVDKRDAIFDRIRSALSELMPEATASDIDSTLVRLLIDLRHERRLSSEVDDLLHKRHDI